MIQIENKATCPECEVSFNASTAIHEGQGKTCDCCGGSCGCGDSCSCGG